MSGFIPPHGFLPPYGGYEDLLAFRNGPYRVRRHGAIPKCSALFEHIYGSYPEKNVSVYAEVS